MPFEVGKKYTNNQDAQRFVNECVFVGKAIVVLRNSLGIEHSVSNLHRPEWSEYTEPRTHTEYVNVYSDPQSKRLSFGSLFDKEAYCKRYAEQANLDYVTTIPVTYTEPSA